MNLTIPGDYPQMHEAPAAVAAGASMESELSSATLSLSANR